MVLRAARHLLVVNVVLLSVVLHLVVLLRGMVLVVLGLRRGARRLDCVVS